MSDVVGDSDPLTATQTLRQAVSLLAVTETRLKVIDHLHDPDDCWIRITQGPFKWTTQEPGDTERYVRLTIDVEDGVTDRSVEDVKVELLPSLAKLRARALK